MYRKKVSKSEVPVLIINFLNDDKMTIRSPRCGTRT